MPKKPQRRNPLPKAPPKRRFAGAPPVSPQQLQSSLARVRAMSGQLDERQRPFSPERPGSWRGSSRDLVVNGRFTVVLEDSDSGADEGLEMVMATIHGKGAARFAKEELQSLGGSNWEADGSDFAYCLTMNQPGLVEELESAGVEVDDGQYTPPDLRPNGETDPELHAGDAWIFDPSVPKDWVDSSARDWEHYSIDAKQARGAAHVGSKLIDGEECEVYTIEGGHYVAQVPERVTGKYVDPRDIPAHLRPAELRELPETNGSNVGYSQGGYGPKVPGWYQVEYATGSDYSGSSVERANYKTLGEMLEEAHPSESEPVVWARTSGGHGTYGIVVKYGDLDEGIRETIDALEDYPSINDEALSELEMEEQNETWENSGKDEFIRAVAKVEGKDKSALEDAITSEQWYGVFRAMCTATNRDWEDQGGEGPWIDMKKLAEELGYFTEKGEFPKHSSDYEDDALQALYDALPGVEED